MKQVILPLLLLIALLVCASLARRQPPSSSCSVKCILPGTVITDDNLKAINQCIRRCSRPTTFGSNAHRVTPTLDRMRALQWVKKLEGQNEQQEVSLSEIAPYLCTPRTYHGLEWFKQCDPRWKDEKVGTTSLPNRTSICLNKETGSLLSSLAMALPLINRNLLKKTNKWINPSTLNQYIQSSFGYKYGTDSFYLDTFKGLDATYEGEYQDSARALYARICSSRRDIILLNMKSSGRWVLVTGLSDDHNEIQIKDPGSTRTSITFQEPISKVLVFKANDW